MEYDQDPGNVEEGATAGGEDEGQGEMGQFEEQPWEEEPEQGGDELMHVDAYEEVASDQDQDASVNETGTLDDVNDPSSF